MAWKKASAWLVSNLLLIGLLGIIPESRAAGDSGSLEERVHSTATTVGSRIEQGVKKTVKKIEEKHVPEKIKRKLKKALVKTSEGFNKATGKLQRKLGD